MEISAHKRPKNNIFMDFLKGMDFCGLLSMILLHILDLCRGSLHSGGSIGGSRGGGRRGLLGFLRGGGRLSMRALRLRLLGSGKRGFSSIMMLNSILTNMESKF